MFKQMVISSVHSTRKSTIHHESIAARRAKSAKSLDKLNRADHLNVVRSSQSRANRCESAKTYGEIDNEYELDFCAFLAGESRALQLNAIANWDGECDSNINQAQASSSCMEKIRGLSIEFIDNPSDNYKQDSLNEPAVGQQAIDHTTTDKAISNQQLNTYSQIDDSNVTKRLRALSSRFKERAANVKQRLEKQLTSEEECLEKSSDEEDDIPSYNHDWFEVDELEAEKQALPIEALQNGFKNLHKLLLDYDLSKCTYELYSVSYISWLTILTIVYLYNCWFILARTFFPIQSEANVYAFILVDMVCDVAYLLDVLWFKSRLRYFENGLLIKDAHLTRKQYFKKPAFIIDCVSLLPLDVLYVFTGIKPLLRFPRFLKWKCFHELFHCLDSITNYPYAFRILKTLIYMLFLVHLNAIAYYYMSYLADFDPHNQWIYDNQGNAYLRCFYFAIRTATSISGRMPKPNNSPERAFMTVSWLLGVFIFAFLIGQIREIVANANQNETHYRTIMDQTINYMNNLRLPKSTQQRVKDWLNFTWRQQNTFDELAILNALPSKSCTDISLNLHLQMPNQVELFHSIERPVICELVNYLRPILFLPGDFVFKKDDIGTDMYIVNKGKVQVFADRDGKQLLITLGEGSVFGEISVLLDSSKRRTASIRSVGYSTLFRLKKADLLDILSNYPEAHVNLKRKAYHLMRRRNKHRLADTVIKLIEQKRRAVAPGGSHFSAK